MPGHKGLYGPQGTGMLLCGQTPDTLFEGGTGSLSASLDMPDFLPDRVEAGTHNVPGIAGLLAGIRYLKRRGLTAVGQGENALLRKLHRELRDLPIRQYYAGGTLQTGVLSLTAEGWDCEELAARLSDAGIAVRAGLHCAPLAHESAGSVKIAPATITPLEEPIDWIITFSPSAFLRLSADDKPTAMMAIGIAASNTCPTFSPR